MERLPQQKKQPLIHREELGYHRQVKTTLKKRPERCGEAVVALALTSRWSLLCSLQTWRYFS